MADGASGSAGCIAVGASGVLEGELGVAGAGDAVWERAVGVTFRCVAVAAASDAVDADPPDAPGVLLVSEPVTSKTGVPSRALTVGP